MFPRFLSLTAAAFACAALSIPMAEAGASTRTYFNPAVFGKLVSLCMKDRATCGKPSADAWCRDNGFAEALTFERMRTAEKSMVFRQIKCINREATVAAVTGEATTATP